MTDRPIIFSAPMVRALLDGRKTQTRRVLKPLRQSEGADYVMWPVYDYAAQGFQRCGSSPLPDRAAPYTRGDRLWVREAWRTAKDIDKLSAKDIERECVLADYDAPWAPIQYESDGARDNWSHDTWSHCRDAGRYRHARFMPRWASRLTLTVTQVRVQRLQEISGSDAKAEGVDIPAHLPEDGADLDHARRSFRDLWNSLHGPDAWDANPWVAAISFTVEKRNIDA